MNSIDELIAAVASAGRVLRFYGPQSAAAVRVLEEALRLQLSPSYVTFLARFGGGGEAGAELAGIDGDEPLEICSGITYGET